MKDVQDHTALKGWPSDLPKKGWMPDELDLNSLTEMLGEKEIAAIDSLLEELNRKGVAPLEITKEDFSHPDLNGLIAKQGRLLKEGPGLVFIKGLPVKKYSEEDIRKIYCGIGSHLGKRLSQSRLGQRLGEVRELKDPSKSLRAYDRPKSIALHTDQAEILSLCCVVEAEVGGESVFASGIKMYETIKAERPEYAEILEKGFHLWRLDEHSENLDPITPYRVPVFGKVGELMSVMYRSEFSEPSNKALGVEFTDKDRAAVNYLFEVRERPEFRLVIKLMPGDMVFINNYEILHGREEYQTSREDADPRFLLRLWLQDESPRELPEGMEVYPKEDGEQGIDYVSPEMTQKLLEDGKEIRKIMEAHLVEMASKG